MASQSRNLRGQNVGSIEKTSLGLSSSFVENIWSAGFATEYAHQNGKPAWMLLVVAVTH